ncbi:MULTISPECIES: hypothetical protein [Lactococcus]|uniref:hypothetical protein n=1 Tax=Lactococcus TaxID=1357 RepID=UPI001BCDC8F6|nr:MULTISPECIES: hypothetical protein [Lactococcus]MBS4463727.1 hypothetical protein [Lactococcus garvieae]
MATNRFAARAAQINKNQTYFDKDLPVDPSKNNGKELNLVDETWEARPLSEEVPRKKKTKIIKKKIKKEYITIKIEKSTHQNLELVKLVTRKNISEIVSDAVDEWMKSNLDYEQNLLIDRLKEVKK